MRPPRFLVAIVVLALFVALAACSGDNSGDAAAREDPVDVVTDVDECDPAIHEALTAWAAAGFSGTVAMTTAGEVDCVAGYGFADERGGRPNTGDTTFAIGSVSKSVTAAAVLGLVEKGRLALTDRAGAHVTGLTGPAADATVESLLLHTSGLTGGHGTDHEALGRDEAVAAISGLELLEPEPSGGGTYAYSNSGYTLLTLVVEGVTGTDFRTHLVESVLVNGDGTRVGGFWDGEPAAPEPRAVGVLEGGEIGEDGSFAGPHYALAGNGDVAMTMPELAAWTTALFTGELLGTVGTDAVAGGLAFELGEGQSETPGWVAFDASVFGAPLLGSSGGGGNVGHDVVVAWFPVEQRAIAIASNQSELTSEALLVELAPALAAGDPLPTPAKPAGDVDPDALAEAAGTYRLPGGDRFVVEANATGLAVEPVGADALAALHPLPEGTGPEEAAEHEEAVLAIFDGETAAARDEIEAIEGDLGPIETVEVVGTVVVGRELRTFVELSAGGEVLAGWYALDERGSIGAVDFAGGLPILDVVPAGVDRYRPADPTGAAPRVVLTFADGELTVEGPGGVVVATEG